MGRLVPGEAEGRGRSLAELHDLARRIHAVRRRDESSNSSSSRRVVDWQKPELRLTEIGRASAREALRAVAAGPRNIVRQ